MKISRHMETRNVQPLCYGGVKINVMVAQTANIVLTLTPESLSDQLQALLEAEVAVSLLVSVERVGGLRKPPSELTLNTIFI